MEAVEARSMQAAVATSYITKQQSTGEKKNQEVKELFL
jgi:hypothetical protein